MEVCLSQYALAGIQRRLTWVVMCRTKIDKVSAELVTLTYGTVVAQLCKDFDSDYAEVNKQLDKMGYNIGLRLIEDYLAKSNTMKRCANFRETADMISRVCGLYYCSRGISANTLAGWI